jgi:folate-dependent phosphoribosylglycinamide formyltransferase PurN
MRIAVVASSIAAGVRIAGEIEKLAGVDIFVVVCNMGGRSAPLRWFRELFVALKSFALRTLAAKAWSYARLGKLIIMRRPLDDSMSIARLRSLQCDVGLHAANVIYREPTISAFRLGILNAHIGILPKYRGRSVVEWSILQGDRTGVTVFFIDSGIDTGGRIVLREFIPSDGWKDVGTLKNMLFGCDARLYRQALETLVSSEFRFDSNDISKGRRYYVMSKMLTQGVNEILRDHDSLGRANYP